MSIRKQTVTNDTYLQKSQATRLLIIIIIHSKYFPNSDNSPSPVTGYQIWKNCVLNEEMTSKMQPSTG